MKKIFTTLAILLICGSLTAPQIEARNNRQPNHQSAPGTRPDKGEGSRRYHNREHDRGHNPSGGHNPNGSHNPNGNRPGHNGVRPGNQPNPQPGTRPSTRPPYDPAISPGNWNMPRPNDGRRPPTGPSHRPQPGPGYHHPGPNVPPPAYRPMPARPWSPPRPPRNWRPGPRVPSFSTVLGISFGTALNLSINALINSGYTVHSYDTDAVYVNNVMQFNMLWPDATLYYGPTGLTRGEFIYYTTYFDTSRYNLSYSNLMSAYGAPVSTTNNGNTLTSTWFGNGGRYVTLSYSPCKGADGMLRYYTTLTFGY